jgi:uncharacterized protein involved in outer membrane biogenesis
LRKVFVAFVLLVVLLVGAVLVGPSFVDWNAYRPEIEAAAKRLTGREIAIDGEIEFALLPKPRLTASQLRLMGPKSEAGPDLLRLKALEVDVALLPLVAGDVQVESIRLLAPEVSIVRDGDRILGWDRAPDEGAIGGRAGGIDTALSLESVVVENGIIRLSDANTGQNLEISGLNLTAAAASLAGPLQARGAFRLGGVALRFDLRLGRIGTAGQLPVPHMALGLADQTGALTFSGRLSKPAMDGTLTGRMTMRTPSLAALAAALLPAADAGMLPAVPVAAEARLRASARDVALNDLTVRIAKAQVSGALGIHLDDPIRFDAALAAGRFDLDSVVQALDAGRGKAKAWPAARWALGLGLPGVPIRLAGNLDLTLDGVTLKGGVMRQVQLNAGLADGVLTLNQARALLPGGSELRLTGAATRTEGVPRFEGRVELASDNLRRLADWLGYDLGQVPENRLANVSLTGSLRLTPEVLEARSVSLRLDATNARGGITYRLQGRPSFGLDLAVDRLNLDGYLPAASTGGDGAALLGVLPLARLEEFDTNLAFKAKRLSYANTSVSDLAVALSLVGGKLTVHEARIGDVAGVEAELTAAAEGFAAEPHFSTQLSLAGGDFSVLAAALGLPAPPWLARLGRMEIETLIEGGGATVVFESSARAGEAKLAASGEIRNLSETPRLDVALHLKHDDLGAALSRFGLAPSAGEAAATALALQGRIEGDQSRLEVAVGGSVGGAKMHVEGSIAQPPSGPLLDLALEATHPEARRLLQELGYDYRPSANTLGELGFSGRLTGAPAALRLEAAALRLGPARVTGEVALDTAGKRPRLEAELRANVLDLDALLPGQAAPARAADEAEGRWSTQPLALDPLRRLDGRLALRADRITYRGQSIADGDIALHVDDGVLTLDRFEAGLYGGKLTGKGRLAAGVPPSFDATFALAAARLAEAAALLELGGIDGALDMRGRIESIGASTWELANSLNGEVRVRVRNGIVSGLALAGLGEALAQARPGTAKAVLEAAFAGGETARATAEGSWLLTNGVARTDDTVASLAGAEATLAGGLELGRWRLGLSSDLRPAGHASAPAIVIDLKGPPDDIAVTLRATAFLRHLARQQAAVKSPEAR